ncbi:MAG: OsmC family protein, partial [Candidatus Hodarchaeales archaeon]
MTMKTNALLKFHITMTKTGPMRFEAKLDRDHYPLLSFDEPPHAGGNDEAPGASRYLVSAILNCLSASLTFCLQKSRIPLDALDSEATCTTARNEKGYWRIQQIDIKLHPKWNDW